MDGNPILAGPGANSTYHRSHRSRDRRAVTAAIAFVVAMLAVVEIILVSCLITPAKTQAVLGRLHDWVQAHIRQVLIAIPAILGVSQVITGMGLV
jgi:small neutral amino acid transporter SnatA (MarC family)